MNTAELISAMDAHDAEGVRLEKEMTALGLDAKKIKAIRKAEAATKKAQATLTELMKDSAPVTEATKEETAPNETEIEPETSAENKKGGK